MIIKAQTIELPDQYTSPEQLCGMSDEDVAKEFVSLMEQPDPGRSIVKLMNEGRYKTVLFFACLGAQKMGEEVLKFTAKKITELKREN